jgi:lactoylglutathione lyase
VALKEQKPWLKCNDNGFKELLGRIYVNIKKVGNVILAVADIDKSLQFYHEIIGLPIRTQRRSWVDLGTSGALLSLHPASLTAQHIGSSIENGITIGFLVGDVKSAVEELKSKGITIYRDIVEKDAGKNAVILDPDGYLISLFEPIFEDKAQQTGGYQGFTPA